MPLSADEIRGLVLEPLEEQGFLLCGIKLSGSPRRPLIQIFIDLEHDSVTIDHCVRVYRILYDILSLQENLPAGYRLEVSSPGVESPLCELWQFRKNLDRTVRISREGLQVEGKLIGIQAPDTVRLETDEGPRELTLAEAAGARIVLDTPHPRQKTKRKRHEARGR